MNIAFLVPALKNKGPVIVVKDIVSYLVTQGHACTVYYFDEVIELEIPCNTRRISFWKNIDLNNFDILHIHCLRPALYVYLHRYKLSKIKIVSTLHQPVDYRTHRLVYGRFKSVLLAIGEPFLYNHIKYNVVLSQVQHKLINKYVTTELEVIENGRNICADEILRISNIEIMNNLKAKYKVIGIISVIIKRKGIEQVVKALKYLPDYAIACVGDGPELNNLIKLSDEEGVSERCLWLGYQPDAANYYKYFDIYALTSRSEGFPLSVIEAASQSSSCVLSNIEILNTIIPKGCATFFQLDDIMDLVGAIQEAYDNREAFGNNLYSYYKENLTGDIMGSKYLNLYKRIVNQ